MNDGDDSKDDDAMKMKNALVLLLCIATYDKQTNLEGVKGDLVRYRNLFVKEYSYTVYPEKYGKNDKKFHWTKNEIIDFIEDYREKLFDKHDGLIIVHRGHGSQGTILASDNKQIKITALHDKVSGAWKQKATKLPRIFIIDACRGNRFVSEEKQEQDDDKAVAHPRSNLVTLYGNAQGYGTWVNNKGGYFSQCVIAAFKNNIKSQKSLAKLGKDMNKICKEKFGDEQIVQYDGDLNLCDLLIMPNSAVDVRFDKYDDREVQITENGKFIKRFKFNWDFGQLVYSSQGFNKGVVSWTIKLGKWYKNNDLGVVTEIQDGNKCMDDGWGLTRDLSVDNTKLKKDDAISFELDFDVNTMVIFVNGNKEKQVDLKQNVTYYPCIYFYSYDADFGMSQDKCSDNFCRVV